MSELPTPAPVPAPAPSPNPGPPQLDLTVVMPPRPGPAPATDALVEQWATYLEHVKVWNDAVLRPMTLANSEAYVSAHAATAVVMQAGVQAQQGMATAMVAPQRMEPPSDEDIVRQVVVGLAQVGVTGIAALNRAQNTLVALRMAYPQVKRVVGGTEPVPPPVPRIATA